MPDTDTYYQIFLAAYDNDDVRLKKLLDQPEIDINATYQGDDLFTYGVANLVHYGKKVAGVTSGFIGTVGPLVATTPVGAAGGVAATLFFWGTGAGLWKGFDASTAWYSYNKNSWTALHFAALGNANKTTRLLLERHANAAAKDDSDRTAENIAAQSSFTNFNEIRIEVLSAENTALRSEAERRYGALLIKYKKLKLDYEGLKNGYSEVCVELLNRSKELESILTDTRANIIKMYLEELNSDVLRDGDLSNSMSELTYEYLGRISDGLGPDDLGSALLNAVNQRKNVLTLSQIISKIRTKILEKTPGREFGDLDLNLANARLESALLFDLKTADDRVRETAAYFFEKLPTISEGIYKELLGAMRMDCYQTVRIAAARVVFVKVKSDSDRAEARKLIAELCNDQRREVSSPARLVSLFFAAISTTATSSQPAVAAQRNTR